MQSFSQLLEQRVIEYFKRKYGLEISPATAQEYLKSFAELFMAFTRDGGSPDPVALAQDGTPTAAPDLISPHNCNEDTHNALHL